MRPPTPLHRVPEPSERPDPRDTYLDAARACILDVGWKRTTLTEVARRAGVSRMTIYRTWPDMTALNADLMTREWGRLAVSNSGGSPGSTGGRLHAVGDPVQELAADVVAIVAALRDNELFVRIVELDPELLLPYLLGRRGRSQDHLLGRLEQRIAAGQQDGRIRAGDPRLMARGLVLAGHGFVLSAHTMLDGAGGGLSLGDLDAELSRLVIGCLR